MASVDVNIIVNLWEWVSKAHYDSVPKHAAKFKQIFIYSLKVRVAMIKLQYKHFDPA